ncbi:MAG: YebC/PmpR family DNA-binding transcriptional regulator, partial [Cyclobacteriaceae bacterium]|nr:YebC/PmpR family DNA-binding transcriptional regulator [Cyclobacteriaceae bacterium]MCK5369067.1 YebC/PmpR family DNA-binding transcriptional regulator [Cyclobacteriaceae bacterium]
PRLRLAVANAKGNNMPKDNIGRAIKKATGSDAEQYHETTYEGYATHGVAVFVECLTDNSNRTVSSVRSAFTKHGGSLGTNGSLEFIFDRKGVFSIKMTEDMDEDEFSLEMIDAGAEDETLHDGYLTISCDISDFGGIQKKLEELGVDAENAELQRIPNTLVTLGDDDFGKVMKLIDALEDNDDVQKVFHNLDITEAQMELL